MACISSRWAWRSGIAKVIADRLTASNGKMARSRWLNSGRGKVDANELFDRGTDYSCRVVAAVRLAKHQSALKNSRVAIGKNLGVGRIGARSTRQITPLVAQAALVRGGGLMSRVVRIWKFNR